MTGVRGYLCGVNEVEQPPDRRPRLTLTVTFTLKPGVAPLM